MSVAALVEVNTRVEQSHRYNAGGKKPFKTKFTDLFQPRETRCEESTQQATTNLLRAGVAVGYNLLYQLCCS